MNISLRYNDTQEVEPSLLKMTFYEELYTQVEVEDLPLGKRIQIHLHPKQDIHINELSIVLPHSFHPGERLFCNGFQSQSDSRWLRPGEQLPALSPFASSRWKYGNPDRHPFISETATTSHSWTYGSIAHTDGNYSLFASLSEHTGFTIVRYLCKSNVVKITWEAHDFPLKHSFPALDVLVLRGSDEQVFGQYADLLKKTEKNAVPIRTCISISLDFAQRQLVEQIRALEAEEIPLDLVLVDEGFPFALGDWSAQGGKAVQGIGQAAAAIHQLQQSAGISFAPFLCSVHSDFFKNKKDYLLKDDTGKPLQIKHPSSRKGDFYVLDFYKQQVKDYLTQIFRALCQQHTYDFLRLDALHYICLFPPKGKTSGQLMCEAIDFLKNISKGAKLLTASLPLGAAMGRVDYCQLACYPVPTWKSRWLEWLNVREAASFASTVATQLARRYITQWLLRQSPSLLSAQSRCTDEQYQCLLLINCLTGAGLVIPSTHFPNATEDLATLREALDLHGAHIDKVLHSGKYLLEIHFRKNGIRQVAYCNLGNSKMKIFVHGKYAVDLLAFESLVFCPAK